ncbi:MAG: hypothetical protein K0S41_2389 [Anaerocolumna sp.]|jgi:predicted NBD/HSP70 family sugar kinase|nr:hypothetical protein [Anaerocolumna sp.]
MEKANRNQMKEINKNMIRKILKERRKATKPELAEITQLSVVTVNALISEMIISGEAIEGDDVPSNGGRPSKQYIYNGNYKLAAIIYGLEKEKRNFFSMLLINLFGECIERRTSCIEYATTESFESWIDEAVNQYQNISAILFGLPGVEENGVITSNDFPGLIGDKFITFYKNKYKIPVLFENDVNATVWGYYQHINSNDIKNVVGLYYPRSYGPGAGIVIQGNVYKGNSNFAGEFAFISVKPSWDEVDFDNTDEVILMLSQILVIYSCVLAPERFVLYGDFLTEQIIKNVIEKVTDVLQGKFTPFIEYKNSIDMDYELGLIHIAINQLEKSEDIKKWS